MPRLEEAIIAPSILAADFAAMGNDVKAVVDAGAQWLHLDVMDGHFVPNMTFGPQMVAALKPLVTVPFDVHLMIEPADAFIEAFAQAGADHIYVHCEGNPHVHRTLQRIKAMGKKAGVALCPGTPAEMISYLMDQIDMILVMTVNPGFGGQKFLSSQLPKIRQLRDMSDATGRDIRIGVDGGIDASTACPAFQAGADVLVAGTSIFGQTDYRLAIDALRCMS